MLTTLFLSIAGAVIAAVVGTFWYSDKTPMGRIHMKSLGFDTLTEEEKKQKMAEAKPMMFKMYAAQLALSFLTAFFVVFVVTTSIKNGVPAAMAISFPVMGWFCFVVPTIGSAILWSNTDRSIAWQKFFSDIFSNLLTLLLIAFVTVLFV